jgi:tetratricopeptide (TPR) repeat protein
VSEAFRALKEFADLCPGQDDVRLMLAEQLARAGRNQEALEQLQTVYEAMTAEGRSAEASATLARIRALDPSFQPSAERSFRQQKREGLVFLDVDDFSALEAQGEQPADVPPLPPVPATPVAPPAPAPKSVEQFADVPLPPPADAPASGTLDASPLAGLTPLEDPMIALAAAAQESAAALELEPTAFADAGAPPAATPPLDLEHTTFDVVSPVTLPSDVHADSPSAEPETTAWPDELTPREPPAAPTVPEADLPHATHAGEAVTEYVESLSSDIGAAAGGLPGDIGLLPPEALDDVQHVPPSSPAPDEEFVDLNQWLLDTEPARDPRMTAEGVPEGTDGVESDFAQMLDTFKAGVAANVDAGDADAHYDLGVAYMEMGLLDEAIAQFQTAIRAGGSPERRVRAYESLGQSFIEQRRYDLAIESLRGALSESGLSDDKLVGVLYLLGYASEQTGDWRAADGYYRRVFAIDIHFRDIGERLKRAEQMR